MAQAPWESLLEGLRGTLEPGGLSPVGVTRLGAYRGALGDDERERYCPFSLGDDALLVVVGSTQALWTPLTRAYAARPELRDSAHPVDDYARGVVLDAIRALEGELGRRAEAHCVHGGETPGVALIRLATLAGAGVPSPIRLLVHPERGLWLGLRAVVCFDVEGPDEAPRVPSPCDGCVDKPCAPAYEAACRPSGGPAFLTSESLVRDYALFLAARDACPVGRHARYSDAQAEYHYTKKRSLLDAGPTPSPSK